MHFGVVLLQPVRGGGPDDAGATGRPGKAPVHAGQGAGASAPGHQLRCGATVTPGQLRGVSWRSQACPLVVPYCHSEGRCAQAGHSLLWLS